MSTHGITIWQRGACLRRSSLPWRSRSNWNSLQPQVKIMRLDKSTLLEVLPIDLSIFAGNSLTSLPLQSGSSIAHPGYSWQLGQLSLLDFHWWSFAQGSINITENCCRTKITKLVNWTRKEWIWLLSLLKISKLSSSTDGMFTSTKKFRRSRINRL